MEFDILTSVFVSSIIVANYGNVGGRKVKRYTVRDVAQIANVNPKTVRKMCDLGLIPHRKDYNHWRVFDNPKQVAFLIRQLLGVGSQTEMEVQKDPKVQIVNPSERR